MLSKDSLILNRCLIDVIDYHLVPLLLFLDSMVHLVIRNIAELGTILNHSRPFMSIEVFNANPS
jgi:hypothetical protein